MPSTASCASAPAKRASSSSWLHTVRIHKLRHPDRPLSERSESKGERRDPRISPLRLLMRLITLLVFSSALTGCLVVGYSSTTGWSIWPGSLIVTLVLALIYFLSHRR